MLSVLIGVLFCYRYWPRALNPFRQNRETIIFYGAVFTAVAISAVRLIPLLMAMGTSDRLSTKSFSEFLGGGHFLYDGLHLFWPEMYGVKFDPSIFGPKYAYWLSYFGVIPAYLVLYGLLGGRERRRLFWILLAMTAIAVNIHFRPIADLFRLFIYPTFHAFMLKILTPLPICVLIAFGGAFMEEDILERGGIRWIVTVAGSVLSFAFVFLAMHEFISLSAARIGFVIVVCLIVWTFRADDTTLWRASKVLVAAPVISVAAMGFLLFRLGESPTDSYQAGVYYLSMTVAGVSILWCVIHLLNWSSWSVRTRIVILGASAVLVLTVAAFSFFDMTEIPSKEEIVDLASIGLMRFVLLTLFLMYAVSTVRTGLMSRKLLYVAFVLVLLLDLVPYARIFSNRITPAYWGKEEVQYPGQLTRRKDLVLAGMNVNPYGSNLVANGNFQVWKNDTPDRWGAPAAVMRALQRTEDGCLVECATVKVLELRGNIYQDITWDEQIEEGTPITAGAWVRTSQPDFVRILFTTIKHGAYSKYHSGSGEWEWLSVPILIRRADVVDRYLRFHVMGFEEGEFDIFGISIVKGSYLPPFYGWSPNRIPTCVSENAATTRLRKETSSLKVDLKKYRLPYPSVFMGLGHKYVYTHIPYLYKIPSFGGVNGFRSPYFLDLYNYFESEADLKPGGGAHFEYLHSGRFLDLMGCGYEIAEGMSVTRRPRALSRVMFFKNYEVITEKERTLSRLGDLQHDPLTTIILERYPGVSGWHPGERALDLDFVEISDQKIRVEIPDSSSGILLFNDTYDEAWRARVDRVGVPVLRANHNFMAVAIPKGSRVVELSFEPWEQGPRVWISLFGIVMYLVITAGLAAFAYLRRPRNSHKA
jgi:hypothetical protein